jgi:hypothetical protein
MDQSVQVYANSAARGSALVGFVAEGMVSYLKDTNAIEVFDGSSWIPNFTLPSGTSGQFLRSSGGTAVAFADIPVTPAASPTVAGSLLGLTSSTNAFLGQNAGQSNTGALNTFVGQNAAFANTTGSSNTFIGRTAGSATTTGNANTAVGNNTLLANVSGNFNTVVGNNAGSSSLGDNNTLIGASANTSSPSESNAIVLGNASNTVLRCAVTSITALSDERDKKDIVELPIGLQFVKKLNPVKFTWNQRDKTPIEGPDGTTINQPVKKDVLDFGFIAQDLVKAEDSLDGHDWLQLTLRNNPDQLEATQGRLIPILVKAIQELSAEVDALKAAKK